ncbi:triphosphoribosyl-dephospho-CoA synthase [Granulicella mallensis]|uniref:triphosphoribosyl-dephospho-CoA synthase n=1 Tax=Granulicella mallensis (strain ATCC BAA-1857 / DSM 23137 / MP5ACTX8) TaxID=682795 RepID=G8NWE7_GRAMM|nr:triphosphoribosyl-dephospho-CoA synthase [Granulicella mallensis]AEU37750.1 triphosphoribosyl-dephospho-CoA synthase MdcB [Granulicella mallensis MP5ACTX8]
MANMIPMTKMIPALLEADQLPELARQALVAEAELTPKPGLVDRRGSGAHSDLSLDIMQRSARAIAPYFATMAAASCMAPMDRFLRAEVAAIGREAEAAMLRATGGSNAHKGAIWVLGLLVTAAAQSDSLHSGVVAKDAAFLAQLPDSARPQLVSHGDLVRSRYGATGARGEAYAGFPHVVTVGLPALRGARARGLSETNSRLSSLLSIMASLEDTCVLYRGGDEGLQTVKRGAKEVLVSGGPGSAAGDEALRRLDRELFARNISPGGSADLLAATLFLDAVERGLYDVERDTSLLEGSHGTD